LPTNKFEKNRFIGARIVNVKSHGSELKVLSLSCKINAKPGQFVMLWLPGVGERPFCPTKANPLEIAVKKRGVFTERLFELKAGDYVGVRGPYGKGFAYGNVKKACLVAGGIGIAALIRLAKALSNNGAEIDFIYCAKNSSQMLFLNRIENIANLLAGTGDGSYGKKANCVELLAAVLPNKKYDCVYCCGPEPMMANVLELCVLHNVPSQFSLERKMKCAVGLCGSCAIGNKLVCREGPVFSGKQLTALWH